MLKPEDYNTEKFPTWCPGCGDYAIWAAMKQAFVELNLAPHRFVIVFGIGCSGNMANFVHAYGFHGLHGRPVPVAEGIKIANHKLPVIVVAGDGDSYGEGLNHLLHAARGNQDLTMVVHDNQVYGLTTGQTSPTSEHKTKTHSTPDGVIEEPVNPLGLTILQGASFVARAFAGDIPYLTDIFKQAIAHKGFSLVDIFQPCVTFNKTNTYDWFREKIYKLDNKNHNKDDKKAALDKALESDKLPIGVFYQHRRPTYQEEIATLKKGTLLEQQEKLTSVDISKAMEEYM
jgi:2-oxoglutarate/2-oxoacid ferredoxin oxidoreductase subunit beta